MSASKLVIAALLAGSTIALASASVPAAGQATTAKIPIRSQDDLPRLSYPVPTTATDLLLSDPAVFSVFAAKVGADLDAMLAKYDITDRATLRGIYSTKSAIASLTGNPAGTRAAIAMVRSLQDKPDAKLLSGLRDEAMMSAAQATGATSGAAYEAAFAKAYAAALQPLPWAVVGTSLKGTRSSLQLISRDLVIGGVKSGLDASVAKTHQITGDEARGLIAARYSLLKALPLKGASLGVLNTLVAANNIAKPDMWAARDVTLTEADHLTPVNVAIWDSGIDLALFPGRVYTDLAPGSNTEPHGIAYDLQSRPTTGYLLALDGPRTAQYAGAQKELKGLSDLQLAIDSPEADLVKAKFASLKPDQVQSYLETLNLFGQYSHGTHVAGIAARGNPAIRLAAARLTFDWKTIPDLPTEELNRRGAEAYQGYVDWFRRNKIRVVNMSWGGNSASYEDALLKNGAGKDAAERQTLARKFFAVDRQALYNAIAGAPEILFVTAAGNSNSSNTFDETIPSSFNLPNMLTVGAVDQAGDEASFTTYGTNVIAHANGFQVESYYPGGALVRESGTSMASPNVVNLAAKLIALDPSLTPAQVKALIVAGTDVSADGRRFNVNPKASVAMLKLRHHHH